MQFINFTMIIVKVSQLITMLAISIAMLQPNL